MNNKSIHPGYTSSYQRDTQAPNHSARTGLSRLMHRECIELCCFCEDEIVRNLYRKIVLLFSRLAPVLMRIG